MVPSNKYAKDRFAQEFGIRVSNALVSVPAHVQPPPMMRYHESRREKTCAPSVGKWNKIGMKIINLSLIIKQIQFLVIRLENYP